MLLEDNPNADDAATMQDAIRIMLQRFKKAGHKVIGLVLVQSELDAALAQNRVGDTLTSVLFPDPVYMIDAREMPRFDGIRIKMGQGAMDRSVFVVQVDGMGQMNAHKRLFPFDAEIYSDVSN